MTHPTALRDIAQRIANAHLEDADFALVYEDDELQDLTPNEWSEIHDLVVASKAVLPSE